MELDTLVIILILLQSYEKNVYFLWIFVRFHVLLFEFLLFPFYKIESVY